MKNKYEIRGAETAIFIHSKSNKYETIIDTCELSLADKYKGTYIIINSASGKPYVRGNGSYFNKIREPSFSLARMIMGEPENLVVDHINGDTLNNRRSNLRAITLGENNQNLHKVKKNKIKRGICWRERSHRWVVQVGFKGKRVYYKEFINLAEAEKVSVIIRKRLMKYSDEGINIADDMKYILNKDIDAKKTVSGIKHIYYNKPRKKWNVSLRIDKKLRNFGYYEEFDKAIKRLEEVIKEYQTS